MVIKIIWGLIALNGLALLIFLGLFVASTEGRNVDYMEKGWMTILFILGFVIILLAALPLHFGHSRTSIFISGFFAALPLLIASGIFISHKFPRNSKGQQSMAEFYYKNNTQRTIAAAIEQSDTAQLAKLIIGRDLNIQGNRVWNEEGLSYLQFAIRMRRESPFFPLVDTINKTMIRMLVEHGSATTPALPEATVCLPPEMVTLLLDNGADPNTHGFVSSNPLLFETIGATRIKNDIAILLIEKGADVNARNDYEQSPLMFAAQSSGTSEKWADCWRLVLYLLEKAKANYQYTRSDGRNLAVIIREIRTEAEEKK